MEQVYYTKGTTAPDRTVSETSSSVTPNAKVTHMGQNKDEQTI